MSWRDEEADPVIAQTLEDGTLIYEPDPELRDEERISLKTDIDAYFTKEVIPYAPDAWMDRSKDKIGYEISFARYFYEYRPPRDLKAILADLEALDADADKLQAALRV